MKTNMDEDLYLMLLEKQQIKSVLETNQYTNQFGLTLSEEDTKLLVKERNNTLKEQQRVEFGEGILNRLIFAFCDSDFIYQENYVETIVSLQEIFYLYKNESMDELTDDELIDYMKNAFNGDCQGSLEYLSGTFLERLAREIRTNTRNFFGSINSDEE